MKFVKEKFFKTVLLLLLLIIAIQLAYITTKLTEIEDSVGNIAGWAEEIDQSIDNIFLKLTETDAQNLP